MTFAEKMMYVQYENWRDAEQLISKWYEDRNIIKTEWEQAFHKYDHEAMRYTSEKLDVIDNYYRIALREI